MKKAVLIFVILLIPATMLLPQKAEIVVDAPSFAEIGELVTLDASSSTTPFSWYFVSEDADFKIIENGKKAVFCARKLGDYTFILTAANGSNVVKVIKVRLQKPVIVVTTILDEITKWLPKNADPTTIEKVARSFERVASAGHTDIGMLVKTTAASNRAILGDNLEEWKPFLVAFSKYLKTNLKDKDIDVHVEIWFKLASALRDVKC